jgi:hypothetical protein
VKKGASTKLIHHSPAALVSKLPALTPQSQLSNKVPAPYEKGASTKLIHQSSAAPPVSKLLLLPIQSLLSNEVLAPLKKGPAAASKQGTNHSAEDHSLKRASLTDPVEINWSNSMTKNLSATTLDSQIRIYQVHVLPS